MNVGRLEMVLAAHVTIIANALQAAGITPPGPVVTSWPEEAYLRGMTQIIAPATSLNGPIVALTPFGQAKNVTRWVPSRRNTLPAIDVPLSASVAGNTATFAGSVIAGLNIALFVGAPLQPVVYQTVNGDTLSSLPATLVGWVNALNIPLVTASYSANSVSVTGPNLQCVVGGTITVQREVQRRDQAIMVTIYTPDGFTRGAIVTAIEQVLGTTDPAGQWIPIGDGTMAWTRTAAGPRWTDEKIEDGMLKRADLFYNVEFGILSAETLSQIVAFETTFTNGNGKSLTIASG